MTQRDIINLYSRPQQGGELPYFTGRQYGGNWKQILGRFALFLGRKFGLPVAKTVGSAALKAANEAIFNKRPVKEAIKENMLNTLPQIKSQAIDTMKEIVEQNQGGGGRLRKRLNQAGNGIPAIKKFKALKMPSFSKRKLKTINKRRKVSILDE